MKAQTFTLLIVDDDQNDRFFIERAFHSVGPYYKIHSLENGNEAIRYIRGDGKYRDRVSFKFPSYIITDLKMPEGDGFDLLNHIKSHPALSIIPVVMLSGAEHPADIRHAYLLGVSSFFTKPSLAEDLAMLIRGIHNYWSQCQVPVGDSEQYGLMADSAGKAGERFPMPQRWQ